MFVIDASLALAWCFEDEASPRADAALEGLALDGAVAPAIWPYEIANALRSAERRGRIDEREMLGLTRLLGALPVDVEETPLARALAEILPLARALALSAYDASYVELALRRGVPLATADDQLAQAALAAGAQLLGPAS